MSRKTKSLLLEKQELFLDESESLRVFTKHLGYVNAPFHLEWYDYLENKFSPLKKYPDREKKFLLLWPRGHGKTTSNINYILWLIGKYPNININIVSKTASLAESINMALMSTIESHEKYIEIFGELKPSNPKKWTTQQFIVNRSEISNKNPTVKATGLMGPITGGRSDLALCDDIIDEENVRTRLQLEKVSTWFNKVLYPTLYPWGGILAVGTRWHYADLYAELLEKWNHDIKPAINKDNTVLWPSYWPLKRLLERKKDIGSIIFNCQYQNDPTEMEGDLLKSKWLHPWTLPPLPANLKYAGVDPALDEGDMQAIAILSQDRSTGQAYLHDVWIDNISFPLFLKKINQLHQLHKFAKIFIESNAFQKLLLYVPELTGLPTVPTPTVRDKASRFIAMSSHFESERVRVNPLLVNRSEFWTEWVQFPRGQYDDGLDACEIVCRNVVGKRRGFVII